MTWAFLFSECVHALQFALLLCVSITRHNWYKEFMLVNLGQDFDVYLYQDQNVAICDDIRALMLE